MEQRFRTIVADPPWEVGRGPEWASGGPSRELTYPTMSAEEIAALPIHEYADKRCHLYLWTVNAYVEDAYDIVRRWGFKPSTLLTWCKPPNGLGLGGTYSLTTEHVLFARRGVLAAAERVDSTWWEWPRRKHSEKPEAFLDMVERVSPAPRLELFARRARFGWEYAGNESLSTVKVPGLTA